ncbi:9539_t:CDS:2 [Acaulospora morrowiae]|uniref:9539_t:CDS:1 n=1 Tax=Acaulospora morrowiae TaxID=94023 RepID=A0A9N9EYS7_9GLOM|nr:9539_t:CDS:2 [Acaulospora morrowiae]
MEKAIRGATKPKRAPPKQKYVKVLIPATANEKDLETILRYLNQRLREQTWTVVFKSLIVLHLLMKEGASTRVLKALAREPTILEIPGLRTGFHALEQAKNIHSYATYLEESVSIYRDLKIDYAMPRSGISRLRNLTVAKGLLREVKLVQKQLGALLSCKCLFNESSNEVTICAFKLLVNDLLDLFQALNEGVINVLEHFMEMSKIDANTALHIYKTFVKQTGKVVEFFEANVSLTETLEDYYRDPDFEANREQYRRLKDDWKNKPSRVENSSDSSESAPQNRSTTKSTPTVEAKIQKEMNFDFFSSIEQEQIAIFGNQYHNPYVTQDLIDQNITNPFLTVRNQTNEIPLVPPINQFTFSSQDLPVQDTNPFRSSIFSQGTPSVAPAVTTVERYNPFQSSPSPPTNPFASMNSVAQPQQQLQLYQPPASYSNISVDSNPFRRLSTVPGFQSTTPTPLSQSLIVQDSPAIIQTPINTNDPTFPHIQYQ